MGLGALGDAIGGLLGGGGSEPVPGLVPTVRRQIKVEGTALSEEIDNQVESVIVTDRLRMPDSFVLTLRDPGVDMLGKAKLKIGATVTILAGPPGAEDPDELMVGEVASIEAEYDRLGTRAIVRGYDLLYRMSAGTKTRTFDNVSYADVVKKIAYRSRPDGRGRLDAGHDRPRDPGQCLRPRVRVPARAALRVRRHGQGQEAPRSRSPSRPAPDPARRRRTSRSRRSSSGARS